MHWKINLPDNMPYITLDASSRANSSVETSGFTSDTYVQMTATRASLCDRMRSMEFLIKDNMNERCCDDVDSQ